MKKMKDLRRRTEEAIPVYQKAFGYRLLLAGFSREEESPQPTFELEYDRTAANVFQARPVKPTFNMRYKMA